jgi:hypothetical protein
MLIFLLKFWELPEFPRKYISFHQVASAPTPKLFKDLVRINNIKAIFTGKQGMRNFNNQKNLVEDALVIIKDNLEAQPAETEESEPPKNLKVDLMKH